MTSDPGVPRKTIERSLIFTLIHGNPGWLTAQMPSCEAGRILHCWNVLQWWARTRFMPRRDRPADAGFWFHIVTLVDRVLITKLRRYLFWVRMALVKKIGSYRSSNLMNVPVRTPLGLRSFSVRWKSHADIGVYYQVFINRDYDLARFVQGARIEELHRSMIRDGRQPLIIDAGANIGASSVWFASHFPRSKIVAVEPAPGNCELLRQNCAGFDFELISGGISCVDGTMYLHDPGCGDWGFRVTEEGSEKVPVFSASRIVESQTKKFTDPLICKIDIEGGEEHLFRQNTEWVDRFPLIVVELHDYMLPGNSRSKAFLSCIARYDFDFVPHGENVFCFNNRILR